MVKTYLKGYFLQKISLRALKKVGLGIRKVGKIKIGFYRKI